jgi:hypothetical protein
VVLFFSLCTFGRQSNAILQYLNKPTCSENSGFFELTKLKLSSSVALDKSFSDQFFKGFCHHQCCHYYQCCHYQCSPNCHVLPEFIGCFFHVIVSLLNKNQSFCRFSLIFVDFGIYSIIHNSSTVERSADILKKYFSFNLSLLKSVHLLHICQSVILPYVQRRK